MVQSAWKGIWKPLPKAQRKSIRMQQKLFLYWSSMMLVVLSIFLVVLNMTGVFSALDEKVQQIVSARQKNIIADLSEQFGRMTAQGIAVSEQSSALISNYLFTDPVTSLNDDPVRIEKLEFDTSKLPGYEGMLGRPAGRLAENALWTEQLRLTDTWENVMLLMVPILGNDGSVLGVCGLELSELYFLLSYPSEESGFGSMVTFLAPMSGDTLLLSHGMAGRLAETYLSTEEVLQVKEGKYFNRYIGSTQTFLGVHTRMDLRMADGSQLYAVTLVPEAAYLRAASLERVLWMLGAVVVLGILLALSIYFSRSFAQPLSQSLESIRNEGPLRKGCSGVSEIDELFDFIQAKMQTAGGLQLPPAVEELFSSFAQRAAGLTPTEHNILRYYADGKGISEVAEEACISINTVRRHNANIYQKLEVGSREELLLYIELFRRCDRLDELL